MQYTHIDKCAKNGQVEVANMEYLSTVAVITIVHAQICRLPLARLIFPGPNIKTASTAALFASLTMQGYSKGPQRLIDP
jgi:hypothetical protein